MNRQQALVTSFAVFLVIMVGLVGWMLFGMSNAKSEWLATANDINADLDARYVETIRVERTDADGLVETITVDDVPAPDCTVQRLSIGWDLSCTATALTPEAIR